MAKRAKIATDAWIPVDVESFDKDGKALYKQLMAEYATAKATRVKLIAHLQKNSRPPTGKTFAYGFRFGRFSMAITDAPVSAVAKKTISLADFLAFAKTQG